MLINTMNKTKSYVRGWKGVTSEGRGDNGAAPQVMRTTEKHFYCPHFKDEKTKVQKVKSIAQDFAISKKSGFKAGSV